MSGRIRAVRQVRACHRLVASRAPAIAAARWQPITRATLLTGIAATAAVAASNACMRSPRSEPALAVAPQDRPGYYPPTLTHARQSPRQLRERPRAA